MIMCVPNDLHVLIPCAKEAYCRNLRHPEFLLFVVKVGLLPANIYVPAKPRACERSLLRQV